MKIRNRIAVAAVSTILTGCVAPMANFSNPYNVLLPANYQIRESTAVVERERLPQQKVALVIGPNYEAVVAKFQEIRQFTANMNALRTSLGQASGAGIAKLTAGYSGPVPFDDLLKSRFDASPVGKEGDRVLESSAPEKKAEFVVQFMAKLFGRVEVFPDFASARESRPDFIALFDEGAIRHSMTDWTRVAMLDLFTPGLERVVAARYDHRPKPPEISMMDSQATMDRKSIEWNIAANKAVMNGMTERFMTQLAQRSR